MSAQMAVPTTPRPAIRDTAERSYEVTPLELFFDLVFVFAVSQLGRTVWTHLHAPDPVFRDHYYRTLLWLVAISPLWLIGAAADPEIRLLCWALAAGIDVLGASLAHPIPGRRLQSENLDFDA